MKKKLIGLFDKTKEKSEEKNRLQAMAHYNNEAYVEAIKVCDVIIRLNPEDAGAWYIRGDSLRLLGRYEEAIRDLDESIRLYPIDDAPWYFRGEAKRQLARYEEAIRDYDEAIQLNPKYDFAWIARGYANKRLGRYQEAIRDHEEALRLNPESINVRQTLAEVRKKLSDQAPAVQKLNATHIYAALEPEPIKQIINKNDSSEITRYLALALNVNKQSAIIALLNTGKVDFYTMIPDIKRTILDCLVEVNNPEIVDTVRPYCPAQVLALWAQKIVAVSGNLNGNLLGKMPLHLAAIAGNSAAITQIIANNVPINGRDRLGRTALFYAVCKGLPAAVNTLICLNANTNLHGIGDKSPLQMAIEAKNEEVAGLLITNHVDVNYFAPGTEPPLNMAITQGLSAIALMLIMHHAAINNPDKDGAYPLHLATLANQPGVVAVILDVGANPNACLANNITALHFAASENFEDIAKALLAKNATIIDCLDINRRSPLHYAADTNAINVMRVLVHAGTNINACDAFGDTALHIACEKGNFEAAQFLVQRGAKLELPGRKNLTPRQLAEEVGKPALIKLFNSDQITAQVSSLVVASNSGKAQIHYESQHDNGNHVTKLNSPPQEKPVSSGSQHLPKITPKKPGVGSGGYPVNSAMPSKDHLSPPGSPGYLVKSVPPSTQSSTPSPLAKRPLPKKVITGSVGFLAKSSAPAAHPLRKPVAGADNYLAKSAAPAESSSEEAPSSGAYMGNVYK